MKRKILLLICLIFSVFFATASAAAEIPDNQDNPIDRNYYNLMNAASFTSEQRLIASSYITAWQDELVNVVGEEKAAQELQDLYDKAVQAFDNEISKWGNGTGGPGAGMVAQAQVYRDRALKLIREKDHYEYSFFAHTPNAAYVPVLTALLNSQIYHYDAFDRMPDSYTTNMTLYQAINQGDLRKIKNKLKLDNGVYLLTSATEDAEKSSSSAFSPEAIYDDIFYAGVYSYPDSAFQELVTGTQNGLIIQPQELRYKAEILVLGGNHVGDQRILHIFLARIDNQTNEPTLLGEADVILQTSAETSSGFTIATYSPSYDHFSDVSPFILGQ